MGELEQLVVKGKDIVIMSWGVDFLEMMGDTAHNRGETVSENDVGHLRRGSQWERAPDDHIILIVNVSWG